MTIETIETTEIKEIMEEKESSKGTIGIITTITRISKSMSSPSLLEYTMIEIRGTTSSLEILLSRRKDTIMDSKKLIVLPRLTKMISEIPDGMRPTGSLISTDTTIKWMEAEKVRKEAKARVKMVIMTMSSILRGRKDWPTMCSLKAKTSRIIEKERCKPRTRGKRGPLRGERTSEPRKKRGHLPRVAHLTTSPMTPAWIVPRGTRSIPQTVRVKNNKVEMSSTKNISILILTKYKKG